MKHAHTIISISYVSIFLIISGIVYTWFHEWQEIEVLEVGNRQIDEFRKEINRIHIRLIEFSLLGETVLDWDEMDLENYHTQRIALDSTLCLFNKSIRLIVLIVCAVYWRIRNGRCSRLSG